MNQDLVRQGIAAAKAGQKQHARELLLQAIAADEENSTAWLWLSGVVDDLAEREICLENVLTLDADNEAARRGLAWVRQQMAAQAEAAPESPVVTRTKTPVSAAAAILHHDLAPRQPPEPEPQPPLSSPWEELDDELLCPYCGAPTRMEDRRCRSCGGKLWIEFQREKRSTLLWLLIMFQAANTIYLGASPLIFFIITMGRRLGDIPTEELLLAYLGLPSLLDPATISAAFAVLPRFGFFMLFVPALFSLVMLVGLYQRWRVVYYLLLASALLSLVSAVAGMAVAHQLAIGVIGIIVALTQLVILFNLSGDFARERWRILMRADSNITDGATLLLRAETYARRKMWAMAALHYYRATIWLPQRAGVRLALAVVCMRMQRYDLAELALDDARRVAPDDPRIAELAAELDEQRSRAAATGGKA